MLSWSTSGALNIAKIPN